MTINRWAKARFITDNDDTAPRAMNALQLARLNRLCGLSGPLAGFLAALIYGEGKQ